MEIKVLEKVQRIKKKRFKDRNVRKNSILEIIKGGRVCIGEQDKWVEKKEEMNLVLFSLREESVLNSKSG